MRLAAGIEYDGSAFQGWQVQSDGRSVQQAVQKALSSVAAHPVRVVCAGRTDAGVHAIGQIVHYDVNVRRPPHAWVFGANSALPADVNLLWTREVDDDFHARFAALERTYRYWILNRRTRSSLGRHRLYWVPRPLRSDLMQAGARHLIGEHDFSAFRAAECQAKSPVRRVERLDVRRHADLVCVEVSANAFLHHMVRNIVGVLIAIGHGEAEPQWAAQVLAGRDRRLAGVTAPPEGLYLAAVRYPEHFDLPRVTLNELSPLA